MKQITSAIAIALTALAFPAFGQTNSQNPPAPNAQNSGAGVSGYPGNKNGPAARGGTVGSSSTQNQAPAQQDAAKVQGLPGNKSGPPAKAPNSDR